MPPNSSLRADGFITICTRTVSRALFRVSNLSSTGSFFGVPFVRILFLGCWIVLDCNAFANVPPFSLDSARILLDLHGTFPFHAFDFQAPPSPLVLLSHRKTPKNNRNSRSRGSELKKTINVCPRGARAVHRLLPSIARYPLQQFD
jgi:hypothetical protein